MSENLDLSLIIIALLCLMAGGIIGWLMAQARLRTNGITQDTIDKFYVRKEVYDQLLAHNDLIKDDLLDKELEIRNLGNEVAARKQALIFTEQKLTEQKQEINQLQEKFKIEFENIANRLLEEKSQRFSLHNQTQMTHILNPLKEKIKEFEDNIEKKYLDETKERISLKKEIEQLRDLNQQLSNDANNLVHALKGENKVQGDWGELRLEMLLQKAGLAQGIHFAKQQSFRDEEGAQKRPDFIIFLPDNKHLIIDTKVSLTAYERFFSENDDIKKQIHLKSHIESLRGHIKDLSSKNYQNLNQLNTPDYLLLFVPIEPALNVAMQEDNSLFIEALDRNIVIVTTSTLLATMRTVSYIWTQEKQKSNVLEIARQSGLLYDKFVAFYEDLKNVGSKIDNAKSAYDEAMNKLVDSKKYGDTLVGRAERIKELGAKTNKSLPKDVLDLLE